MSNFLSSLVKSSGNKYASLVSDGLEGSDVSGFVDTELTFLMDCLVEAFILACLVTKSLQIGRAHV